MKQIPKTEIVANIEQEHARLLQTLSHLSDVDWLTPGVLPLPAPGQTCKDVLAHVTAWEQRMMRLIEAKLASTPLPHYPSTPKFNEQVFYTNKDRPLAEIQSDFAHSYAASCALVQRLSEAELACDGIWQLVGYNTYSHYQWAHTVIRRWQKAHNTGKG